MSARLALTVRSSAKVDYLPCVFSEPPTGSNALLPAAAAKKVPSVCTVLPFAAHPRSQSYIPQCIRVAALPSGQRALTCSRTSVMLSSCGAVPTTRERAGYRPRECSHDQGTITARCARSILATHRPQLRRALHDQPHRSRATIEQPIPNGRNTAGPKRASERWRLSP